MPCQCHACMHQCWTRISKHRLLHVHSSVQKIANANLSFSFPTLQLRCNIKSLIQTSSDRNLYWASFTSSTRVVSRVVRRSLPTPIVLHSLPWSYHSTSLDMPLSFRQACACFYSAKSRPSWRNLGSPADEWTLLDRTWRASFVIESRFAGSLPESTCGYWFWGLRLGLQADSFWFLLKPSSLIGANTINRSLDWTQKRPSDYVVSRNLEWVLLEALSPWKLALTVCPPENKHETDEMSVSNLGQLQNRALHRSELRGKAQEGHHGSEPQGRSIVG